MAQTFVYSSIIAVPHWGKDAWLFLQALSSDALIQAYAQIMAVLIVLLLTVSLIPIQQCASQYSASLVRVFLRDTKLRRFVGILLVFLTIVLIFCQFPANRLMAYAGCVIVLASFAVLIAVIMRTADMLNPAEYLLPSLKHQALAALNRGFALRELKEEQGFDVYQKLFKAGTQVLDFPDINAPRLVVSERRTAELRNLLGPIKTLGIRFVLASDYESFERLTSDLGEIVQEYLNKRKEYRDFDDRFVWFLRDVFEQLMKTAEGHTSVSFSERLFGTIRQCADASLEINVLGRSNGFHQLQLQFASVLSGSAGRDLDRKEADRAFDAAWNLGETGLKTARAGFGYTAAEIATRLYYFAARCLKENRIATSRPTFYFFPRIFYQCVSRGKMYPDYRNPIDDLTIVFELLLKLSIENKLQESLTNELFERSQELNTNISSICAVALFSPNNSREIAEHQVRGIQKVIRSIRKYHVGSNGLESRLTAHLYDIGLMLLASIDNEVFVKLEISDKSAEILKADSSPRREALSGIISHFFSAYSQSFWFQRSEPSITGYSQVLGAGLSLLYLLMHFDAENKLAAGQNIDACLRDLIRTIASLPEPIPPDDFESFLLLASYLERSGRTAAAGDLRNALSDKKGDQQSVSRSVVSSLQKPYLGFSEDTIKSWSESIFQVPAAQAQSAAAPATPAQA